MLTDFIYYTNIFDHTEFQLIRLVSFLSLFMNELLQPRDLAIAQKEVVYSNNGFCSQQIPAISIQDYLTRFVQYSVIAPESYLIAFIYILRWLELQPSTYELNSYTIHRLLGISLGLAEKVNFDCNAHGNGRMALLTGISLVEYNSLEIKFLETINYNLLVYEEEMEASIYTFLAPLLIHDLQDVNRANLWAEKTTILQSLFYQDQTALSLWNNTDILSIIALEDIIPTKRDKEILLPRFFSSLLQDNIAMALMTFNIIFKGQSNLWQTTQLVPLVCDKNISANDQHKLLYKYRNDFQVLYMMIACGFNIQQEYEAVIAFYKLPKACTLLSLSMNKQCQELLLLNNLIPTKHEFTTLKKLKFEYQDDVAITSVLSKLDPFTIIDDNFLSSVDALTSKPQRSRNLLLCNR